MIDQSTLPRKSSTLLTEPYITHGAPLQEAEKGRHCTATHCERIQRVVFPGGAVGPQLFFTIDPPQNFTGGLLAASVTPLADGCGSSAAAALSPKLAGSCGGAALAEPGAEAPVRRAALALAQVTIIPAGLIECLLKSG